MDKTPIIDMHIHLYQSKKHGSNAKKGYNIWEYGEKKDVSFSDFSGDLEDTLEAIHQAGADKGVIVNLISPSILNSQEFEGANTLGEKLEASNKWVCILAKQFKEFIPYIGVDPSILDTADMIHHIKVMKEEHGAKGVKVHGVHQKFFMHDDRMMPIWKTCADLDLPVIAHAGPERQGVKFTEPHAFAPLLEALPDLKVVLAHMGGGNWKQLLEISRSFSNAFFDISEIIEWTGAPRAPTDLELANLILDVGPERVMMGSDFPWYDIDHTINRVMELPDLSKDHKIGILGVNAARILGI
jgi:predicted TIM-barrel fold metal-dependent hydrolase